MSSFALGSSLATIATVLAVIFGLILGVAALFWLARAFFKGIGWALGSIGRIVHHVFECLRGIVTESFRAVGSLASALVLIPMALVNVALGRWAAARHFVRAGGDEAREFGTSLYLASLGWPARLLGLGFLVDGLEERMSLVVATAPGAQGDDFGFPGYTVISTLPRGGSGAQLFLATPSDEHRARFSDQGVQLSERVVIKAFGLGFGSSLPQMMRENRALDAARRMGLVFEHSSEGERFWYVMPYVPGDDLGVVTRRLHDDADAEGLDAAGIDAVVGYSCELLRIIGRFHDAGVWHKDIKPSNIVVNGPNLELVDLGLVTPLASAMTLTTHGTEYYRDPDLVRQAMRGVKVHEVDGVKFDLYSAGAVMYSMIEDSFPAHGNLSRFTKRCPEALAWIVRRAMADASQRYGSAEEMLLDLAKIAAAKDAWALRPADLPSMGGGQVAVASAPDRPLPPLRASTRPSTPTAPPPLVRRAAATPPPLPHRRRQTASNLRRAERQARHRKHEDARARARRERPKSSPVAVGAMAVLVTMFFVAGFVALMMGASQVAQTAPAHDTVPGIGAAPAQLHASASARSTPTSTGVRDRFASARAGEKDDAKFGRGVDGDGPVVVLLTERPLELLEDVERDQIAAVVDALGDHFGWQVVAESSSLVRDDFDEEALLAEARSAALMNAVGDPTSAARLQAWLDAGSAADAVLWLGFDERNQIARHALVVERSDGDEELLVRSTARDGGRLTSILR